MPRSRTPRSIARQIDRDYQETKHKIEEAMARLEKGSTAYLNHLKELYDIGQRWRRERSERNLDPQSLGLVMTPKYEWKASVQKGKPVVESAADAEIRRKLDDEFGGLPAAKFSEDESNGGSGPAPTVALRPRPRKPAPETEVTTE